MKCPKCGLENPPGALRCDCGYDFHSGQMQQSYATAGAEGANTATPAWEPASQAERLVAYVLDMVVIIAIGGGFAVATEGRISRELGGALILSFLYLYHAVLNVWPGQTLGKWAVGTQIMDLEGRALHFGRSAARSACFFLSVLPLGLGLVSINFSARRRALHDYLAGTYVATVRQKGRLGRIVINTSGVILAVVMGFSLLRSCG